MTEEREDSLINHSETGFNSPAEISLKSATLLTTNRDKHIHAFKHKQHKKNKTRPLSQRFVGGRGVDINNSRL